MGWTSEKLKTLHCSIPFNPPLDHPMYLAGYIERLGTGTADIIRLSKEAGLQEPEFLQDEDFKTILYRKTTQEVTEQGDSKLGDKLGDTSMKIIVAKKQFDFLIKNYFKLYFTKF